MDIDYTALRAELTTDPLTLGYATMTPDAVVAAMKAHTSQINCLVPLADLQALLMQTVVAPATVPVWWAIKSAATTNPLAEMAFDLFSSRFQNLDTRGAFQAGALTQLQAQGFIDAPTLAAINAMAVKTVNRGELLFGRLPTSLEVQIALLPA